MYRNIVKKSLGLLFAYAIIIVGIFIIQFRSDSIISEKIGALRITLAEVKAEDGSISLRNRMNIHFNGISFIIDEEHPATILYNGEQHPLTLMLWRKPEPLSAEFMFSDNVALRFSISDDTDTAHLAVRAMLPNGVEELYLPYELISSAEILTQSNTRLQLGIRNKQWELIAADVEKSTLSFTPHMNSASYSYFDATKRFNFESIAYFATANETSYNNTVGIFKQNLIAAFTNQSNSGITEQEAVSFVAAMSERGRYNEALDAVPSAFRRGTQRTYLSSPYFDSLATMLPSLQQQLSSYRDIVSQNTLDAFTVPGIVDYVCMHPNSQAVRAFLATGAMADAQTLTVRQAAGMLNAYNTLAEKNATLAALIESGLPACIEKITNACAVEDEFITISENGTFLSVIDAALVGDALIRYGKIANMPAIENGGYLIINSYLMESASFDLRTLAELYPVIVHNNPYYPHFAHMGFDNGEAVWAWTCSTNMTFAKDSMGTITLTIDFPQSYTHYVIINGIRRFSTIYIYNMAFRTDPRFETYNSSGYVFRADTNTMLLKSRHREQIETVRLVYSDAAREAVERRTITETDAAGNVLTEEPAPQPATSEIPDIPMRSEDEQTL
ncbi:MAG: hypothetical protein J6I73_07280 [Treponema sp.]|nr:hypothetical protein [Treponema sp.]